MRSSRLAAPRTLSVALVAAMACAFACLPAPASAGPPRLLYAEALVSSWEPSAQPHSAASATPGRRGTLRFDAFGRSYALDLAANTRLAQPGAPWQVDRGSVAGVPGSWARIMRRGNDSIGVVFDGEQLLGIEPADGLAEFLDADSGVPRSGNLVYRYSDLIIDADGLACGLEAGPGGRVTAAAAAAALATELDSPAMAGALASVRRVLLAPVADYEFAGLYGANAESEVVARLNIADGIFSAQVGIDIASEAPLVFRSLDPPYPFTADTSAPLLAQVSNYRLAQNVDAGLTHLFTGKRLEGNLVGIAWQGAVCYAREGAALSTSAGLTRTTSALIAAHEIGHNFGAPHDGAAGSACASTPATFLMAARSSGSSTFSTCSLTQMAQVIAARAATYPACLTLISDYDVSVSIPDDLHVEPGVTLDIVVTVRNLGTQDASAINLRLSAPAPLVISGVRQTVGYLRLRSGRGQLRPRQPRRGRELAGHR